MVQRNGTITKLVGRFKLEGVILLDYTAECCNTSWRDDATLRNNWKCCCTITRSCFLLLAMIAATKKLWGMSVAGYVILENFSHNLCHNKIIAKQVAGKFAKCNRGLKERWRFGMRTNKAKCGFNLLVDETEWLLATGIEQNWKKRSEIQNFHGFQKKQLSDIFCLLLMVYNVMLKIPILSKFLFSDLILYSMQWPLAKKKISIWIKSDFFLWSFKTWKFYFIAVYPRRWRHHWCAHICDRLRNTWLQAWLISLVLPL